MALLCDHSAAIAVISYDVGLGIRCDVKSARNSYTLLVEDVEHSMQKIIFVVTIANERSKLPTKHQLLGQKALLSSVEHDGIKATAVQVEGSPGGRLFVSKKRSKPKTEGADSE